MGSSGGKCCSNEGQPSSAMGVEGETGQISVNRLRKRYRTMGRASSLRDQLGNDEIPVRPPTEKDDEEVAMLRESLKKNPNLQKVPLDDDMIQELVNFAWKVVLRPGQTLMHEGDMNADSFYFLASGTMQIVSQQPYEIVTVEGMTYLAKLEDTAVVGPNIGAAQTIGPKSSLGEVSMLYGTPRFATCTALESCTLWAISQAHYKKIQREAMQNISPKRRASLGSFSKQEEDLEIISTVLRVNDNLQRLVPLNQDHINMILPMAWREDVPKGGVLMNEGDLEAEAFYITASGTWEFSAQIEPFEVKQHGKVSFLTRAAHTGQAIPESKKKGTKVVERVGRGLCFGEVSMLYCAGRFATVKALEDGCSCWAIDRASFQSVQLKAAEDLMKNRIKYLEPLQIIQSFPQGGKEALAGSLEAVRFKEGEYFYKQGDEGSSLMILYEGAVTVSAEGSPDKTLAANAATGTVHCFGEQFLNDEATTSKESVKVISAAATALVLDREDFMSIWDGLIEAAPHPAFERYETKGKQVSLTFKLSQLNRVAVIGVGAFGAVELCAHKTTKEIYVLKTGQKGLIVQRGMRKSVMRERNLRMLMISPFIIRVYACFNEPASLHLLLEACLGGELGAAYQKHELYGSVRHVRYHSACIVHAFDHLHRRRVIYRNLKPQNVLLSRLGHPKLADMGLAKLIVGQTYTACGTPNYMAPEVITGVGHNRGADWWSMGVLLFELMTGSPPFHSDHPMQTYSSIMRGIGRVEFPFNCRGPIADLIQGLCQQQSLERLPMRLCGIAGLKEHSWYDGFDWAAALSLTMEPPYVPVLKNETDTSAFHPRAEDLPNLVPYVDDFSGWADGYATAE